MVIIVRQRGSHQRGPCRRQSRRAAEPLAEELLRACRDVRPARAASSEERRRPRPFTTSVQVPTSLGQHRRYLIGRQALDQVTQLIALGAHALSLAIDQPGITAATQINDDDIPGCVGRNRGYCSQRR